MCIYTYIRILHTHTHTPKDCILDTSKHLGTALMLGVSTQSMQLGHCSKRHMLTCLSRHVVF